MSKIIDIKLIGILNDSASEEPFFNGLPLIGEIYLGHLDAITQNSWIVKTKTTNNYCRYPKEFFMPLCQWRENQINSILDEE